MRAFEKYHWKAVYTPATGDPNNLTSTHNGNCSDANENVVVNTVASSMDTGQSFIPNDSATISAPAGTGNLAGSVTFQAFEGGTCSGTSIYGPQTVNVSGASPRTVITTNTAATVTTSKTISWRVSYTSTNPAQDSIGNKCTETSTLTISNGSTQTSP